MDHSNCRTPSRRYAGGPSRVWTRRQPSAVLLVFLFYFIFLFNLSIDRGHPTYCRGARTTGISSPLFFSRVSATHRPPYLPINIDLPNAAHAFTHENPKPHRWYDVSLIAPTMNRN